MNHDCADNVRSGSTEPLLGITSNQEEPIRVGIRTASSTAGDKDDRKLGDIEDFAHIANQVFGRKGPRHPAIIDIVQAAIVGSG